MKKYITLPLSGYVEALGNDYNKGFRQCKTKELAQAIEALANDYDDKGYDLFSITPIIQGEHVVVSNDGGWASSVTEGVFVSFKRRD